MMRRCLGWYDVHDAPKWLGEVPPLEDRGVTDGMCRQCAAASALELKARERVRLVAYFSGGRTSEYVCDRLGAALRLRFVRKLDHFKGHSTGVA